MKIGELSERSGLSVHTIRYYERIGLLPHADRDVSGRRDYHPEILGWIAFLGRLKATDMSINDMLKFSKLRVNGSETASERRAMLEAHRDTVLAKIALLQDSLKAIDIKIAAHAQEQSEEESDETNA
ncbi:MAG: MerR family transcriptional regulator [Pseudomonadota bacterium]